MGRLIMFATTAMLLGSTALPALAEDIGGTDRSGRQGRIPDVLDNLIAPLPPGSPARRPRQAVEDFGNVLKLEELAANPNFILPGNPFGSKLFKQIADQEMPYDVTTRARRSPA